MAPKPPTLGSAATQPWRSSVTRAAPTWPPSPQRSEAPAAQPWRSSVTRAAPTWPPSPQRSEAPRRSGGASRRDLRAAVFDPIAGGFEAALHGGDLLGARRLQRQFDFRLANRGVRRERAVV